MITTRSRRDCKLESPGGYAGFGARRPSFSRRPPAGRAAAAFLARWAGERVCGFEGGGRQRASERCSACGCNGM